MHHRTLLLALCPLALFAQPAENDQRVLQTLISEVQQLRLAIERSTLLGARTQLAISQFQLQEARVEKLSRDLNDVRELNARTGMAKTTIPENLKELESRKSTLTDPKARDQMDVEIKHLKGRLEEIVAQEQRGLAREGELVSQAQAAERALADSRGWIAEMQRSLDAAIQQMLKPR